MKRILLVAKIMEETSDQILVMLEGSPRWIWVSRKAISAQSKTRRATKKASDVEVEKL